MNCVFFYTIRHIFPSTPSSQNFSVSQYARRGLLSACLFIFHLHKVTQQLGVTAKHAVELAESWEGERDADPSDSSEASLLLFNGLTSTCQDTSPLNPASQRMPASDQRPHSSLCPAVTAQLVRHKKQTNKKKTHKRQQAARLRTAPERSTGLPKIVNWSSRAGQTCELLIEWMRALSLRTLITLLTAGRVDEVEQRVSL